MTAEKSEKGVPLETEIESVVVYRKGARVSRAGKVSLEPGEHVVVVSGLPRTLDEDSVRVKGTGRGTIVNIRVEKKFSEISPQEEVEALKARLEEKDRFLADLDRQLGLLRERFEKTESLQSNTYEQFPKYYLAEVGLADFQRMEDYFFKTLEKLSRDIRELNERIKDARLERERIRLEMERAGFSEDVEESYDVKVTLAVSGGESTSFSLVLSYLVLDAHWTPLYDAIIDEGTTTIKVKANVVNLTTEDWVGVQLEVSTATLTPVTTPVPEPLVLTEFVPPPPPAPMMRMKKKAMPKRPMKELMKGGLKDVKLEADEFYEEEEKEIDFEPPAPPVVEEVEADVSESVGVQSFKLQKRVDIPSDNEKHPVTLTTVELKSEKKLFWSVANPGVVVARETIK
ncbi:MAG: mucoidy inhibitor MuiA family protein, partial [Promethearchaeota archaeon]